jgi:uncharacterized membrane protein
MSNAHFLFEEKYSLHMAQYLVTFGAFWSSWFSNQNISGRAAWSTTLMAFKRQLENWKTHFRILEMGQHPSG